MVRLHQSAPPWRPFLFVEPSRRLVFSDVFSAQVAEFIKTSHIRKWVVHAALKSARRGGAAGGVTKRRSPARRKCGKSSICSDFGRKLVGKRRFAANLAHKASRRSDFGAKPRAHTDAQVAEFIKTSHIRKWVVHAALKSARRGGAAGGVTKRRSPARRKCGKSSICSDFGRKLVGKRRFAANLAHKASRRSDFGAKPRAHGRPSGRVYKD